MKSFTVGLVLAAILSLSFSQAQALSTAISLTTITVAPKTADEQPLVLAQVGSRKDTTPSLPLPVAAYQQGWTLATSGDPATIVSAIQFDRDGRKIAEAYDCNHDGFMDNWYFFEAGLLTRQEVDTNFDQKLDIWVYLVKAVYVRAYERDRDFDGVIDITKIY